MENNKILIVQSVFSIGGMNEYASIFKYGYGNQSKKIVIFENGYWINALKTLFGLNRKRINYFIKQSNQFDILHITDNAIFDFLIIKKLLKKTNCLIIYTMHDPIAHKEKTIIKRLIRRITQFKNNLLIKKSSKRLIIHVHSKKLIPNQFINFQYIIDFAHPLSIVNNTVDDIFNIKSEPFITISFVGRVEYYKGINGFLKSIEEIDDRLKIKLNIIIAGRGKENLIIPETKYITIRRINKFLSNDEFDSIIKFSDAIVLPYIEATASGIITRAIPLNTPVICSKKGSMPDYIENGVNGLVIKDEESLTQTILNFIERKKNNDFNAINNHHHPFSPNIICSEIIKKVREINKL